MNSGPTEVKHCIYVSIYRFHSLMHDLYRPAQVCTIFDHLSQRNISLSYRLWILLPGKKKSFSRTLRENASKKIQAEFKNETTLYKKRIATLRLGTKAFFKDFFVSNGLLSIPLVIAVKEKKKGEKKQQKQKNILKKITESSPSLWLCLTDLFVDREHKKEAKNCLALASENFSK